MSRLQLLKIILFISVTAVLMLPLYSFLFLSPAYNDIITTYSEKALINLASQMVNHEDLDFQISTDVPLPKTFIDKVNDIKETVGLWKVKVFTTEGVIVYSTDSSDIGNTTRKDFFPEMLLSGNPRTRIENKQLQKDNGKAEELHFIETYVPIFFDDKAIGAFEIYFDVTDIHNSIHYLNKNAQQILFVIVMGLLVGIFLSISWAKSSMLKLEMSEDKFKKLSVTDSLTGLLNRRGFIGQAEKQLEIANRGDKYFYLVFIDVNDFKSINDNFGHDAGDIALTEVANILINTFRSSDIIGRLGGDEFAVLSTQHSKLESETSISRRIIESVQLWKSQNKSNYDLSLTFGMAPFIPNTGCELDDLLSQADDLMYDSKQKPSTEINANIIQSSDDQANNFP
jgi:diguanylate cyclase (GGDEF)-like protein